MPDSPPRQSVSTCELESAMLSLQSAKDNAAKAWTWTKGEGEDLGESLQQQCVKVADAASLHGKNLSADQEAMLTELQANLELLVSEEDKIGTEKFDAYFAPSNCLRFAWRCRGYLGELKENLTIGLDGTWKVGIEAQLNRLRDQILDRFPVRDLAEEETVPPYPKGKATTVTAVGLRPRRAQQNK